MFRKTILALQTAKSALDFVPRSTDPVTQDVEALQELVSSSCRLLVITGAGLSTESGIPDYRSEGVGLYARTDRRPMNYQNFVRCDKNRQRYWARSFVGWPRFAAFQPNVSHKTFSEWEQKLKLQALVTQNVDSLHTKAGSAAPVELHGCLHTVICLQCPSTLDRWELQALFRQLNPDFNAESLEFAPDGDVMLSDQQVQSFQVPACPSCGGVLKPDVVFFGDNVPRPKVDHVFDHVQQCDAMLVAGSSLQVYSAYRFVKKARELDKPIAIVNIGTTRADQFAKVKVSARCGHVLPLLQV